MPYCDPDQQRAGRQRYEDKHPERRKRFERIREATAWADEQIYVLKSSGVVHTAEEWRALRTELRRSKISELTAASLKRDPVRAWRRQTAGKAAAESQGFA
jgi:hypothetical protein